MRAWSFARFGGPEVLELTELAQPEPGPGQVLLNVLAAGINHFDLQARAGHSGLSIPLPFVGGMELVGTIAAVGAKVAAWQLGERVLRDVTDSCGRCRDCRSGREWACRAGAFTLNSVAGGFGESVLCDARRLIALPASIADAEAAALQVSYGTAWHMLFGRANLRAGETVLVSSVGSGLGSAAVDIAKFAGAYVIGTASTDEKLERSRARGLDIGINYCESNVVERVREITGGRGVDVAFEHVGGEAFTTILETLATDGRLVTAGWQGGRNVALDLSSLVRNRKAIFGSVNRTLDDLHRCIALVAQGALSPAVHRVFGFEQATEAMKEIEERRAFGKVVLRVRARD